LEIDQVQPEKLEETSKHLTTIVYFVKNAPPTVYFFNNAT